MQKKQLIRVVTRGPDFSHFKQNFIEIEKIRLVLRAEQIGNFNPVFCTYKGRKCPVLSSDGDISDPFRREDSYLTSLYIEIDKKKGGE